MSNGINQQLSSRYQQYTTTTTNATNFTTPAEVSKRMTSLEDQMQVISNILTELTRQAGGEIVLPLATVENDGDDQMLISWDKDAGIVKLILLPDFVKAGIKAQQDEDAREAQAKLRADQESLQQVAVGSGFDSAPWQLDETVQATGGPTYKVTGTFQANGNWTQRWDEIQEIQFNTDPLLGK